MSDKSIERKYPRFFSSVVRVFLIVMIAAFTADTVFTVFDSAKIKAVSDAAFNGGSLPESFTGSAVINSIKLLSGSLIFTFSYLSFLFLKGREYIFFFITAALVLVFAVSAVTALLF